MSGRALLLSLLFFAACDSSSQQSRRDGMLQFEVDDLSVAEDLSVASNDLSATDDLASTSDLAVATDDIGVQEDLMPAMRGDMAGAGGCNVKVNELLLSTTQSESEEYVELYNSCSTSKSLKGWSLRYRSANNNSGSSADTILVSDLSKTIAGNGYLLYRGSKYTGSYDGTMVNGLSDSGGGVAVVDKNSTLIDSVAYGSAVASHNFLEGSVAPLPPSVSRPGKVIARTPNGHDTDDNSADFVIADPTPKAAN